MHNNQFGGASLDLGSNENEQLHGYFRKLGIAANTRGGKRCVEQAEMQLDYCRISKNSVLLNKMSVRGRGSGDVRYYEQVEAIKRMAAVIFNVHFEKQTSFRKVFSALESKSVSRMTIEDLHAAGFKTVAGANTPWTKQELALLTKAICDLKADPSLAGDFNKIERWIAWQILGGSRTENAVSKELHRMLRSKCTLHNTPYMHHITEHMRYEDAHIILRLVVSLRVVFSPDAECATRRNF